MRYVLVIFFLPFLVIGCKKDDVPAVRTSPIESVGITNAFAEANILSDGGAEVTSCGFCWDTQHEPTIDDKKVTSSVNFAISTYFAESIPDLKAGTGYFLRGYAINQVGIGYGNEIFFTTKPSMIGMVSTGEITEITKNSALCEVILYFDGGGPVLSQGVCFSLEPEPTVDATVVETSGNRSQVRIQGLLPNTTYYVRAYVTNPVGTAYGLSKTFKTENFFKISSIVSEISSNSAKCTISIISDGEKPVLEWGICWDAVPGPSVNINKIPAPSGSLVLITELTNLSDESVYYIRPYVLTSLGIEYGNEFHFKTKRPGPVVTDIDGNIYNIVTIGNQTWMSENLCVTKFANGYPVTESWVYNNDNSNVPIYGRLYSYTVASSGSICPAGWHVPSNNEWSILGSYLIMNGYNYDGSIPDADPYKIGPVSYNLNKLAKSLTSHTDWSVSTVYGSAGSEDFSEKRNLSGFDAKPGGMYFYDGSFYALGSIGIWWSSDVLKYTCGVGMHGVPYDCWMSSWSIVYDYVHLFASSLYAGKIAACSIRCIKD